MIWNDIHSGILVVNLDKHTDRWARISAHLDEQGVRGYERVPGVLVEEIEDRYKRGCAGCLASHLKCLRIAKERGWESVLILEDDAAVEPDFEDHVPKCRAFFDSGTPWDMFYWGVNHFMPPKPTPFTGIQQLTLGFTTHAYAAHQRAYDYLIALLEKPSVPEVDVIYGGSHCVHSCFSTAPRLVYQLPGESEISGLNANYTSLRDPR